MNLDLYSLNLKSKSKYTTPRVPIKTNLIIEKKPKLYSTPNSAKKSRFVPPIAIPISDLDDFEEKSDRKSSHVKFLTEPKEYSTPRSIQTFVLYRNGDLNYTQNATKIQRNWRAYIKRKRFRKFINFIRYIRRKTLKFGLHMWILSLQKPANISKRSYRHVISFMKSRGYIFEQGKNHQLITKDQQYNVNDFDQTIRTDFLFMQPRYPYKIIYRYQRSFYFPLIQNIFTLWSSAASERLALKRSSRPMRELARRRLLYGPIFWTFYFWQRWAKFNKTKQIPKKVKGQLFITEWSMYIAKKKKQFKINQATDKLHQRYIKSIIISQLRIKSANRSVFNKAFDRVQKNHNASIMMLSLRGFNILVANKQFSQNIKRRVIRSWYKVIDLQIISRMKTKVMKYRSFLKSLKNSFKKWHEYVINEGVRRVLLHDLVNRNNLLMLKTFFLLKSDFPHFSFVAAFLAWKKILIKNHNKRKFIQWSTTQAKPKVTLLSLLNILKEYAAIRLNSDDFHPFDIKDIEKVKKNDHSDHLASSSHSSSVEKNAKRKRLIKAMKKGSGDLLPIKVFTTSVDQTIHAYKKLNDFEMCDADWHKKMTSDDVKTLFYRLIIVLCKRSSPQYSINKFKTTKEKIEVLKKFQSSNLLFNLKEIHNYKVHQDRQDIQHQLSLNKILKRDSSLFLAFDTHEAAISLHKVSKNFEINQIPIEDVSNLKLKLKKTKTKKKSEMNENENSNQNKNENKAKKVNSFNDKFQHHSNQGKVSKDSISDHPFLRPIESVKKSIDINNRKYRRSPEDIFDVKESSTTLHNLKLINKLGSTASQAKFQLDTGYEQFTPLRQSLKATRMMSSREFLLKELSGIHDTATNELEKINEGNEYEIYSKEDLDKIKDDELFEKQVVLPSFDEIPTIYKPLSLSNLDAKLKETLKKSNPFLNSSSNSILVEDENSMKLKNGNEVDSITGDLNNEITINDLSKSFIDDPGYFEYSDAERAAMLTNKYLRVLEVLIDDSISKPSPPKFSADSQQVESIEDENEQIRSRISSIIRRVTPQNESKDKSSKKSSDSILVTPNTKTNTKKNGKRKKKVLFQDPDKQFETIVAPDGVEYKKSNCPEFSNVAFSGTTVLTSRPWETEIEKQASNLNSSGKKLKKKRKKRHFSIDGFSSSDEDYSDKDKDDSEINMTSLPKPMIKVSGFDDDENSNILNSSSGTSPTGANDHLFDQINSFLSSSYTNTNDQQQLIDKLRQEASSGLNNTEEMKRTFMLLIDAVAHKYVLNQLDSNLHQSQISLVDIDGANSKEVTSDDESLLSAKVIQQKLHKPKYCETRKFAAFGTESRLADPPEIIERKFTFTKDLIAAITENAKFASTLKMDYFKDISKLKPFEGMKMLAKRVRDKLSSMNRAHVVKSSASYDESKNEICLSIGKVSNKKQQQQTKKTKPKNQRPSTATSKIKMIKNMSKNNTNNQEFIKLEINPRPRTPLIDGCLKPEPGNKKVVKRPIVMKRKPQFTKMTPSNQVPLQPPDFHVSKEFNDDYVDDSINESVMHNQSKSLMLSGPPAKLKWNLPSDRIDITEDDVDFFMFVTPYILPPEFLNKILEKQEKNQNQTI